MLEKQSPRLKNWAKVPLYFVLSIHTQHNNMGGGGYTGRAFHNRIRSGGVHWKSLSQQDQVWGISETRVNYRVNARWWTAHVMGNQSLRHQGKYVGGQIPFCWHSYIAHSRDHCHHMSRLLRVGALDSETLQHTNKRLQINI